jgi:hypothetical protein
MHSPKVVSLMQKKPDDEQGTVPSLHMLEELLPLGLVTTALLTSETAALFT